MITAGQHKSAIPVYALLREHGFTDDNGWYILPVEGLTLFQLAHVVADLMNENGWNGIVGWHGSAVWITEASPGVAGQCKIMVEQYPFDGAPLD